MDLMKMRRLVLSTAALALFAGAYALVPGRLIEQAAAQGCARVPLMSNTGLAEMCASVVSAARTNLGLGYFATGTDASNLTGTLALARFGTQSANTVLAGPTSGGAANPTFRAAVVADLPTGTTSSATTIPLNNSARLNYTLLGIDIGTVATATSTASPSAKVVFGLASGTVEIPASTTPRVSCGTNPGGTMTLVWKKNGSTTLCTMSLSTSCAVSSCSISNTSFADTDYLTVESTADATVTGLAFGLPFQKKD